MTKFPLMIVSIFALACSVYADKSATQGWVTKNFAPISVSEKANQAISKADQSVEKANQAVASASQAITKANEASEKAEQFASDLERVTTKIKDIEISPEKNGPISIGYGANATASNSVQIGYGTNNSPNSLQFGNVKLVENGKAIGFDVTELDPKLIDITESMKTDEEHKIVVKSHVLNTLSSSTNLSAGVELNVYAEGSRNYEIYIPNDKEFRMGLPISFESQIDDVETVFVKGKQVYKLPAILKVRQPNSKVVLLEHELVTDSYDWKPVVTKLNIVCDGLSFKTINDEQTLEGYNLQNATEYLLVYPTGTTVEIPVTNTVFEVDSDSGFISGTFFSETPNINVAIKTDKPLRWNGTSSWVEMIYTTSFGTVNKRLSLTLDL